MEVKTGVGDNVDVGESIGNSGVKVGDANPGMGTKARAVCVAAAAKVCAIIVLMAFASGVESGTTGVTQARETTSKPTMNKRIRDVFKMFALSKKIAQLLFDHPLNFFLIIQVTHD